MMSSLVVYAHNLIDPSDECGHFRVESRQVFAAAFVAPRNYSGQFVIAVDETA